MIVCSCGHEVDDFDHTYNVMTKSTSRECTKAIAYSTVCGPCEDRYRQHGELFDTDDQAMAWLNKDEW